MATLSPPAEPPAKPTSDLPTAPIPFSGPTLPLKYESLQAAHEVIKPYIHETPVLTSTAISQLASAPQSSDALNGTPWEGQPPARPRFRFFFKCENMQKIGAFKIRGATHALARLKPEDLKKGVLTHSSGR
jgi:threonine dehydratase